MISYQRLLADVAELPELSVLQRAELYMTFRQQKFERLQRLTM